MSASNVALAAVLVLVLAGACFGTDETGSGAAGSSATSAASDPAADRKPARNQIADAEEALEQAGEELEQAALPQQDEPSDSRPLLAPGRGSAAAGGRIYVEKQCVGCHGVNGAGGTVIARKQNIRPLSAPPVKAQSDAELARTLVEGKTSVSAGPHKSKDLSPEEVRDLIAWIRSL